LLDLSVEEEEEEEKKKDKNKNFLSYNSLKIKPYLS